MTIPELDIISIMDTVVQRFLIPKFQELNMNATGQWLASLETEARGNVGVIRGQDYSEFLAKGRRPGGMPPVSAIQRWVEAKLGLYGAEATSAAWGIAKKIEQEGTSWYPEGSDLLEVLESQEVIDYVTEEFRNAIRLQVEIEFKRDIEKMFA